MELKNPVGETKAENSVSENLASRGTWLNNSQRDKVSWGPTI
jgi:hypothetical protein